MTNLTGEKKLFPETAFISGKWEQEINVRDFIQKNYTPYYGNADFLAEPTEATNKLWERCCLKLQINFGKDAVFFCKKKEKKAAFWIWTQK